MQETKAPWWRTSIFIFVKVSVWIAVPVIIALFLGKWLDSRFGTKPWLFLTTMAISFLITLFGIYKTAVREMKKIEHNSTDGK